jgi:hypothetical protein
VNVARIEAGALGESLGTLERRLRGAAPADVVARLRSIRASIAALVPRVRNAGSSHLLVVVATAALLDAPQAVNAYLALPPGVRTIAAAADEPNPARLLAERLERLDGRLAAVLGTTYADELARLVANGRFLHARFGRGYGDLRQTETSEPGNGIDAVAPSGRTVRTVSTMRCEPSKRTSRTVEAPCSPSIGANVTRPSRTP